MRTLRSQDIDRAENSRLTIILESELADEPPKEGPKDHEPSRRV
jgi:hypothetical protein